ncbi:MAG: DegV family protein [Atopobiaceae bacterium]|nr:DegV family protein [Atopobiaceae bacterium]
MADHTNYAISCCASCDLSEKYLTDRNIEYVYFNYFLDEVPCKDDFGKTNSPTQLYSKMLAGSNVKTSQVSVGEYVEHFRRILSQGKDVLHICLAGALSGTYNSALDARTYLQREFPERDIAIVDSCSGSVGYGMVVAKCADLRDEGYSLDKVLDWLNANKWNQQTWLYVSDLTFLVKGGRVSKAAGIIGGMLKICPTLRLDINGGIVTMEKVRTKKRAIKYVVDRMADHVEDPDYDGDVFIAHAECFEDAQTVAKEIESRFPKTAGRIHIFDIGATIGVHLGPGSVVLSFWGDRKTA